MSSYLKNKDFYGEMNFDNVQKYDKPFAVMISGSEGSGKTHFSGQLSKQLGIYLLNSDYVRYYYYNLVKEETEDAIRLTKRTVDDVNANRNLIALLSNISFVYDGNASDTDSYASLLHIVNQLNYNLIKIRINSDDKDNVDRIRKRKVGFSHMDENVIGDSVFFNSPKVGYCKKEPGLNPNFDYVLDNYGNLEEFDKKIAEIIEQIKLSRAKRR